MGEANDCLESYISAHSIGVATSSSSSYVSSWISFPSVTLRLRALNFRTNAASLFSLSSSLGTSHVLGV